MTLHDPIVAYTAENNIEADIVCDELRDAGIDAQVIEDASIGMSWTGLASEFPRPQVYIERADVDLAGPVLSNYVERKAERGKWEDGPSIEVLCEECGKRSQFPAVERDTIQSCPHCRAYVDVVEPEEWDEAPGKDED